MAGFHADSLQVTLFSRAFAKDKMLAYVTMVCFCVFVVFVCSCSCLVGLIVFRLQIQRKEREEGVETLTHQVHKKHIKQTQMRITEHNKQTKTNRNGVALISWTVRWELLVKAPSQHRLCNTEIQVCSWLLRSVECFDFPCVGVLVFAYVCFALRSCRGAVRKHTLMAVASVDEQNEMKFCE